PTGKAFKAALRGLEARDLRALVIDLRNNPGGLLTAAVEVVEPFFAKNELVVYTEGRSRGAREDLLAEGGFTSPLSVPLAVLVNGGSASASEIVAGALWDTRRAVLVGEKTFGKGSVQSIFQLNEASALRLTTARYFTPSGRMIHGKGIPPDLEIVLTPEQEKAVFFQRLRPELTNPVEFKARFGVEMAEDTQLAAALVELKAELRGAIPTRRRDPVLTADVVPSEAESTLASNKPAVESAK
ncbi:MAG: hypothetical protein EAZ36_04095, partial [Verrucomicrobia bacterium]